MQVSLLSAAPFEELDCTRMEAQAMESRQEQLRQVQGASVAGAATSMWTSKCTLSWPWPSSNADCVQGDGGSGYGGQAGGGEAGAGGQPGGGYEFGVDPNLDPELAMALRVSLEEERARQTITEGAPAADGAAAPAAGERKGLSMASDRCSAQAGHDACVRDTLLTIALVQLLQGSMPPRRS